MLTRKPKYQIVGERVSALSGSLIDIGARDRVLKRFITNEELSYLSADRIPGNDITLDLEKPLPMADNSYDIVVALDILEHLESIHTAMKELLRITKRKLFISLPNMSCLSFRVQFLLHGTLSGKYTLGPTHTDDRHRWVTGYKETSEFVRQNVPADCNVIQYDVLNGFGVLHNAVAKLPLPASLRTYCLLFEITKATANK
ncbi:MAG: hypothetical protein A2293_15270 [Elusimicrobia bacterium RIFOXYB2_FULL_49_7]|nr:MAG: hypothetical protein A2293_15270 [Elusimicrobia bacterium RIFOXYB2_FULL_49_7]